METAQKFLENIFDESDVKAKEDPLVLIKALYLFHPQVDLLWFSSEEALRASNQDVTARALQEVAKAIESLGIQTEIDMEDVRDSLNGNLNSLVRVLETIKKAFSQKITTKPVKDEDRNSIYKVVNPAFKPCVRWLLRLVARGAGEVDLQTECKQMLDELEKSDNKHIRSDRIIPSLCNGTLYQKAASAIFRKAKQGKNKFSFLDDLTESGYFNVKKGLKSSVKEIIADSSAFYESIHVNIIEAFMTANVSELKLSDIEDELKKFPTFEQAKISPFDIEDALNIFVAQFIQGQESTDLVEIIKDGVVFCKMLQHYHGENQNVKNLQKDANSAKTKLVYHKKLISIAKSVGWSCSWTAGEISTLSTIKNQNFKKLIEIFLLEIIQRESRFKLTENEQELPEFKDVSLIPNKTIKISRRKLREIAPAEGLLSDIKSSKHSGFEKEAGVEVDNRTEINCEPLSNSLYTELKETDNLSQIKVSTAKIAESVSSVSELKQHESTENDLISTPELDCLITDSDKSQKDDCYLSGLDLTSLTKETSLNVTIDASLNSAAKANDQIVDKKKQDIIDENLYKLTSSCTSNIDAIKPQSVIDSDSENEEEEKAEIYASTSNPTKENEKAEDFDFIVENGSVHEEKLIDNTDQAVDTNDLEEIKSNTDAPIILPENKSNQAFKPESMLFEDEMNDRLDTNLRENPCKIQNKVENLSTHPNLELPGDALALTHHKHSKEPSSNDLNNVQTNFKTEQTPYHDIKKQASDWQESLEQINPDCLAIMAKVDENVSQPHDNPTSKRDSQSSDSESVVSEDFNYGTDEKELDNIKIYKPFPQNDTDDEINEKSASISYIKQPQETSTAFFINVESKTTKPRKLGSNKLASVTLTPLKSSPSTETSLSCQVHESVKAKSFEEFVFTDASLSPSKSRLAPINNRKKQFTTTAVHTLVENVQAKVSYTSTDGALLEMEHSDDSDDQEYKIFSPIDLEPNTFEQGALTSEAKKESNTHMTKRLLREKKDSFKAKLAQQRQDLDKERKIQHQEQYLEIQEVKRFLIALSRKKEQVHLARLEERTLKRMQKKTLQRERNVIPIVQQSSVRQSRTLYNRLLIRNALVHVCLAGKVNERTKEDVLEDFDDCSAENFIILFAGQKNHTFRGLYSFDPSYDQVLKVYTETQGPDVLESKDVDTFFKYDSGSRSFKPIPVRSFGASVHAVCIPRKFSAIKRPTVN